MFTASPTSQQSDGGARSSGDGAYRAAIDSVGIPARGSLAMSPQGVDLTVSAPAGKQSWSAGDLVPFTLEFRHSGRVKVLAVVVRPGSASFQ